MKCAVGHDLLMSVTAVLGPFCAVIFCLPASFGAFHHILHHCLPHSQPNSQGIIVCLCICLYSCHLVSTYYRTACCSRQVAASVLPVSELQHCSARLHHPAYLSVASRDNVHASLRRHALYFSSMTMCPGPALHSQACSMRCRLVAQAFRLSAACGPTRSSGCAVGLV